MPMGMGMDRPPMPGPDIAAQMGPPPPDAGGPPPGGPPVGPMSAIGGMPNRNGAVMAQVEAIKRVLETIATTEPTMAPFCQRASSILQDGIAALSAGPSPGGPPMPPGMGAGGPPGGPPMGAPGGGMPPLA